MILWKFAGDAARSLLTEEDSIKDSQGMGLLHPVSICLTPLGNTVYPVFSWTFADFSPEQLGR